MPTFGVVVIAPVTGLGERPKAVLAGFGGSVTLDIIRPRSRTSGLAAEWEEVGRAQARPSLELVGPGLTRLAIEAVFDGHRNPGDGGRPRSVEADLGRLRVMARPPSYDRSVVLAYGDHESFLSSSGSWAITSLDVTSLRRRDDDNAITRAEVSLELTEWSPGPRPAQPGTPSAVPVGPVLSVGQPVAVAVRRYTVRAGDTLYAIAQAIYGSTARWRDIAKANGIRDLRDLVPGTVLTIPA